MCLRCCPPPDQIACVVSQQMIAALSCVCRRAHCMSVRQCVHLFGFLVEHIASKPGVSLCGCTESRGSQWQPLTPSRR